MAVKKRHGGRKISFGRSRTSNTKRRKTTRRSNPAVHARSRSGRKYSYSTHKKVSSYRRRSHRRRNPLGVSGGQVIDFAVAAFALSVAQPPVSNFVSGFAGNMLGAFTQPVITAGTGYLLGKLANFSSATRRFSQPLMILGFSTAVVQIVQPYVSNLLGGASASAPAQTLSGPWPHSYSGWNKWNPGLGRNRRPMVRGISAVTNIPPMLVGAPAAAAAAAPAASGNGAMPPGAPAGMNGFTVRPGVWAQ